MVAHNCTAKALTSRQKEKPHSKKNNLTVQQKERLAGKRKTSQQKEKDLKQKENLTAKRKRFAAKFL